MRIIISVITFLFSLNALSQIISLDERRSKNPERGFQGEISYSLNFTHNNKDIIQNGSRMKLQYNDSLNTYMVFGDIVLDQVDKEKNINKGNFGLIYNFMVPDKFISAEAIYQYDYNDVKKLKYRNILGGGPRFKIASSKKFALSLVAYTIYLNEKYENATIINTKSLVKFSSLLNLSWQMTENTRLQHSTYYEPDYSDPEDYRIWSETRFKIDIRKNFSFNLFFKIDYDSITPSGVDNLYYTINNSFNYSF
jgi:putative salt-induced outer membrane protein YdiY